MKNFYRRDAIIKAIVVYEKLSLAGTLGLGLIAITLSYLLIVTLAGMEARASAEVATRSVDPSTQPDAGCIFAECGTASIRITAAHRGRIAQRARRYRAFCGR